MLTMPGINTTFKVNCVSLRALIYALKKHHCAFENPALEGITTTPRQFESSWLAGGRKGHHLIVSLSRREMDENGYEVGTVTWNVVMQIYKRQTLGVYGSFPIAMDPYVVNICHFDIDEIEGPDSTDNYSPPEEDDLDDISTYTIQCALDHLPVAEYGDGAWHMGSDTFLVGDAEYDPEEV